MSKRQKKATSSGKSDGNNDSKDFEFKIKNIIVLIHLNDRNIYQIVTSYDYILNRLYASIAIEDILAGAFNTMD